MANGIRLYSLRKDIKKQSRIVSYEAIYEIWRNSPAKALTPVFVDREYRVVSKDIWNDILKHMGIHEFSYESHQRDCDDFAYCLRGRVPLELGVNGVGIVLDYSGKHAYNVVAVDNAGTLELAFIEPQAPNEDRWWLAGPSTNGMYDMEHGRATF